MKTALIGYTGFVGSQLSTQYGFSDVYNSKNIDSIRDKTYDLIVCAAAPGAKWRANMFPSEDIAAIRSLLKHVGHVRAELCILISTVDVYPDPVNVTEQTTILADRLLPYGKHRLYLESQIQQIFPKHLIVRLPGLFGTGLKKNFIYDLIHNNTDLFPSPESTFQYYPTARLWHDIALMRDRKLSLVNFATEPIRVSDLVRYCLSAPLSKRVNSPPIQYDMHTIYATFFHRKGNYIYSARQLLPMIKTFILREKNTA